MQTLLRKVENVEMNSCLESDAVERAVQERGQLPVTGTLRQELWRTSERWQTSLPARGLPAPPGHLTFQDGAHTKPETKYQQQY